MQNLGANRVNYVEMKNREFVLPGLKGISLNNFVDPLLSKSATITGILGVIFINSQFYNEGCFNVLLLQSRFIARDTSRRLKNMNSSGRNCKVRPSKR